MTHQKDTPTTTESAATTAADGTQLSMTTRDMRRVISSSFIGTTIEYYDFILYATASSIVFTRVFFVDLGPAFALFASFATFAVGYLARPIGGIIFGHFGDTRGRKKVLIVSMLMMGIASTAIGLLPATEQIGILAPIVLVLLRIIQGVAVGGEWGGAMLVALEHAPRRSRGLAASFANAGGPVGSVLATLMLGMFSLLPDEQFLAWGWRVPFLVSVALVGIGLIIRLRVAETPTFQRLETAGVKKRVPLLELMHSHKRALFVAFVAVLSFTTSQGLTTVWGVATAVGNGADESGVLFWKAVGAAFTVVVSIAAGRASDRFGRRRIILLACGLGAVLALPTVTMFESGTVLGFAAAIVLASGIVQGMIYGAVAAFVAEQFPTSMRFSGASVSYQTASTVGAGLSPMIATGLVLAVGGGWIVAAFWIVILCASAIAVLRTGETRDNDLHRE